MDGFEDDVRAGLPPKQPSDAAKDAKAHRSWISRVGTWGSDLVNAVGDGLNYLAGYDELEVTEGDACHAGGRGFESRPLRHLFLIVKNKVLKYNDTLFFAVHFHEKKPN